jgi:hypothetical protein
MALRRTVAGCPTHFWIPEFRVIEQFHPSSFNDAYKPLLAFVS